ncbi:hypothetical protein KFK09_016816 [Dendrobium nobile]|uniref:DUF4283 domain-containing protein n=1 Tax=Dendrobium nobile TaxID=94219 RepID=A0A8T3B0K7_DENNO|nr:hypothetical protein KFK09_016816 [Dendrobium nobile]
MLCSRPNDLLKVRRSGEGPTLCLRPDILLKTRRSAQGPTLCSRPDILLKARRSAEGPTLCSRPKVMFKARLPTNTRTSSRSGWMAVRRVEDPGFLVSSFKSKSFAEALSGSVSSERFPDLRHGSFRGLPSLWISEEEICALSLPFQFALVGFFPTKRPFLDAIRKFFFALKLKAEFSVTVLDQTHVLIKLSNELDYSRVFCHRSYMVNYCFMKITKWSHILEIGCESPVIPIWISFPKLRPHLFTPRILHALGSMFGNPLKVDSATSAGSRPSLARVLVELDVTRTYPKHIWLGPEDSGYIQNVQFEIFPDFCESCKCLGHLKGHCAPYAKNLLNSNLPLAENVFVEAQDVENRKLNENEVTCNPVSVVPQLDLVVPSPVVEAPLVITEVLAVSPFTHDELHLEGVNVSNLEVLSNNEGCIVAEPVMVNITQEVLTGLVSDLDNSGLTREVVGGNVASTPPNGVDPAVIIPIEVPVLVPEVGADPVTAVISDGSPTLGVVNSNGGVQL